MRTSWISSLVVFAGGDGADCEQCIPAPSEAPLYEAFRLPDVGGREMRLSAPSYPAAGRGVFFYGCAQPALNATFCIAVSACCISARGHFY